MKDQIKNESITKVTFMCPVCERVVIAGLESSNGITFEDVSEFAKMNNWALVPIPGNKYSTFCMEHEPSGLFYFPNANILCFGGERGEVMTDKITTIGQAILVAEDLLLQKYQPGDWGRLAQFMVDQQSEIDRLKSKSFTDKEMSELHGLEVK